MQKFISIFWKIIFLFIAVANLWNGSWMLFYPEHWYTHLPAAVPDFGPLNTHFIRDLGCMFITWGLIALLAVFIKSIRNSVLITLTLWYGLHAIVHVMSITHGLVGKEHWSIDFPLVGLPVFFLLILLIGSLATQKE